MAKESSRYIADPQALEGKRDIVTHVVELMNRVSSKDRSLQIGHTAIEDGDLTVRNGDIIVSESDDTVVMRIRHGSIPEIRMYPLGENTTHRVVVSGLDFTSPNGPDVALRLHVAMTIGDTDGGQLEIWRNSAVLSHSPNGGEETQVWLNSDQSMTEGIFIRGRFRNSWQYDNHQAIYAGFFNVPSGNTTWFHTYSIPFASNIVPVCTVHELGGGTIEWVISQNSTSQFTVRFSGTAAGKVVHFWCFRTD